MNRYLILGAGIAGRRAAEAVIGRDPDSSITMVETHSNPFYPRPMLGELLTTKLGVESIASKDQNLFAAPQFDLRTGMAVKKLHLGDQTVVMGNKEVIPYDKLLIASGRRTLRRSTGEFADVPSVVYLDHLDDAQEFSSQVKVAKRAVVFGSSFQAITAVKVLRGRDIETTLVLPEDQLWPGALDRVSSEIIENRFADEGITVLKSAEVLFLEKRGSDLQEVLISSGIRIPADLLVMAAPQNPLADYLENGELKLNHGIQVDGMLHTSAQNVFAAGDIAYLPSEKFAGSMPQIGWLRAWQQGEVAGVNMAGGDNFYKGIPSLRTKVMDLDIVCLGSSDLQGDDISMESGSYPYPELPYIYKKIIYRDDRAVGAIFIGDVSEAGTVESWISKGLKKSQFDRTVYEQMFASHFTTGGTHGVLCPVCKFQMQADKNTEEGAIITCPACGIDFRMVRMPNGKFHAVAVT